MGGVRDVAAGRYRLIERVAATGMSEVWVAQDVELDRPVALKLLGRDADPERFDREARAAAGLSHPHICRLFDYGETDGRRYMVLELLPGGSLEDRLSAGRPLPDAETARIARELASALAYAHVAGVVHRDVKPANILFDDDGNAKLADFGVARVTGTSALTETGTVLGTAAYLSPEQASGEAVGPPADVYAFGVILYRMLTGRPPFEAGSALELASMHVTREPIPIESLRAGRPARPRGSRDARTGEAARRPAPRRKRTTVRVRDGRRGGDAGHRAGRTPSIATALRRSRRRAGRARARRSSDRRTCYTREPERADDDARGPDAGSEDKRRHDVDAIRHDGDDGDDGDDDRRYHHRREDRDDSAPDSADQSAADDDADDDSRHD
jgi:serine/threonine protein kinase